MDAATDAAMALPSLSLTYPITDFTHAWQTVQLHVTQALDTRIWVSSPCSLRRVAGRIRGGGVRFAPNTGARTATVWPGPPALYALNVGRLSVCASDGVCSRHVGGWGWSDGARVSPG